MNVCSVMCMMNMLTIVTESIRLKRVSFKLAWQLILVIYSE